jgi:hypothetical protein
LFLNANSALSCEIGQRPEETQNDLPIRTPDKSVPIIIHDPVEETSFEIDKRKQYNHDG